MPVDCTFSTPEGVFNYRVGAIIRRDDKLLVMREEVINHWYLPGGRVSFVSRWRGPSRELAEELPCPD